MLLLNTRAMGVPLNELQAKPSKRRPRIEKRSDVFANQNIERVGPLHRPDRLHRAIGPGTRQGRQLASVL
jgi:hypothetical protein